MWQLNFAIFNGQYFTTLNFRDFGEFVPTESLNFHDFMETLQQRFYHRSRENVCGQIDWMAAQRQAADKFSQAHNFYRQTAFNVVNMLNSQAWNSPDWSDLYHTNFKWPFKNIYQPQLKPLLNMYLVSMNLQQTWGILRRLHTTKTSVSPARNECQVL